MGGGDLNLKKSWHPSTMKNMEKVWKAEQQDNQEKKRIAELKREIEMEKDREDMTRYAMNQGVIEKKEDKKLDWMYQGPNQMLNREDYLLGRAIDKPFEQMAQAEKEEQNRAPKNHVEYECIPPSLRFFSGTEQVDLARKLQEDPLYAIKKKEMETRSQLLKNPVKLKQLKQLLEEQASKSKADKKRKKKSKKRSKNDLEESNSDEDLDNLLAAKYNKLKSKINEKDLIMSMKKLKKAKKRKTKERGNSDKPSNSSEDEEVEREANIKRIKKRHSNSTEKESEKHRYRRDTEKRYEEADQSRSRQNIKSHSNGVYGCSGDHRRNRSCSNDEERSKIPSRRTKHNQSSNEVIEKSGKSSKSETKRHSSSDSSGNDDPRHRIASKGNYGLIRPDGTKILASGKSSHLDKSKPSEKKVEEKRWMPPKRERLTEDEKEKRRQEMMVNASWRDREREQNVRRYQDEEKRETTDKTYNKEFIRKQLAVAAEVGTVESRIKANMNNIQRSRRAMDTNFAKR